MPNQKIKKLFCILLVSMLMLSIVAFSAQSEVQAAEADYDLADWENWGPRWTRRKHIKGELENKTSEEPAGYTYFLLPDGTACLTGLSEDTKDATEITVPAELDGITVSVLDCRFPEALTKVTLPESLKVITSREVFADTALTDITLPAGLCSIGEKAFYRCGSLTHIELPESLVYIGKSAFVACPLTSLTLPEGLCTVEDSAFAGTEINSVKLPSSLEVLGSACFQSCYNLASVEFSPGLKKIGDRAFEYCSALEHVELPETLECIGSWAFAESGLYGTLTLPASCTRFHGSCFEYTGFTEIHLQGDMTYLEGDFMGNFIPEYCVLVDAAGNERHFDDFYTITEDGYGLCLLDDKRAGIYRLPEADLQNEGVLELPAEVDGYEIVFLGFNCSNILAEKVICPDTVRIIGNSCFNCENATEIVLPEGVERLEHFAFQFCDKLKSIELPASLKYVDKSAFDISILKTICFAGSEEEWQQFDVAKNFSIAHDIDVTFGK